VGGSTRNDTDRPKSEPWRGLLVVAKFSLGADDPTKEDFSLRYAPITSLVYATFTIIYLAFEGAIIAQAVTLLTHINIHSSYVIVSVAVMLAVVVAMHFHTARAGGVG